MGTMIEQQPPCTACVPRKGQLFSRKWNMIFQGRAMVCGPLFHLGQLLRRRERFRKLRRFSAENERAFPPRIHLLPSAGNFPSLCRKTPHRPTTRLTRADAGVYCFLRSRWNKARLQQSRRLYFMTGRIVNPPLRNPLLPIPMKVGIKKRQIARSSKGRLRVADQ